MRLKRSGFPENTTGAVNPLIPNKMPELNHNERLKVVAAVRATDNDQRLRFRAGILKTGDRLAMLREQLLQEFTRNMDQYFRESINSYTMSKPTTIPRLTSSEARSQEKPTL